MSTNTKICLYNWTRKAYPDTPAPPFPPLIKDLLAPLFPDTQAQAAIVNVYSPGDTLALHRDVAEHCGRGLVGLSLGCEGIFVIGSEEGLSCDDDDEDNDDDDDDDNGDRKEHPHPQTLTIRLNSGSAVYMSGPSRFAWHGVAQIIPGSCPDYLADWPAGSRDTHQEDYEAWRGWMGTKRINLNVRQMWDA